MYAKARVYPLNWSEEEAHSAEASTFATPAHRRCDADRLEKMTKHHHWNELLPLCVVKIKGFHKLKHYTKPEYTETYKGNVIANE